MKQIYVSNFIKFPDNVCKCETDGISSLEMNRKFIITYIDSFTQSIEN